MPRAAGYVAVVTSENAVLEGGPFDGQKWDLSGESYQAELTDGDGRTATYFETSRLAPGGLAVWTVEIG